MKALLWGFIMIDMQGWYKKGKANASLLFFVKQCKILRILNMNPNLKILDGKVVRDSRAKSLKEKISKMAVKPKLVIIQIGSLPESDAYIRQKKKFGETIGALVELKNFPENVGKEEIISVIRKLNSDASVSGIIVQLPLPENLDKNEIINFIDPLKDVDGLTSASLKLLWENKKGGYIPATAKAIVSILDYYEIPIKGKRIVVVGRSSLVGKPALLTLLNRDATVTLCHSQTKNLPETTKQAEILIVAIGKPNFIGKDCVSNGQVVIDVGINLIAGTKLEEEIPGKKFVGDVDFEAVKDIVSAISPVPGGVGPMTVLSLFENLTEAHERLN
jgi:methylenetetrahydrofolate dehydrogenase (NADP+)/methenyltetrahydrofolate cyclohydrolase